MKKIIEKLWEKYSNLAIPTEQEIIVKGNFNFAILEAMKAQREACANAYFKRQFREQTEVYDAILNAEVE